MATRMPRFGAGQTGSLVSLFSATDALGEDKPVTFPEPDHRIKADARLMVGDQALSCIKCHTFDKYAATGIQSLDMTTMTRRLRREWFHRYLLDPQKYRSGTRMPAAWPKGRSVVPHILNGDSDVQIEAIWTYLLDGKNAKVPSGLQREAIELMPGDRPIIYRNFLEGLSPRGIAVGFAAKAHFAWDAEHMTPRLIWHGPGHDCGENRFHWNTVAANDSRLSFNLSNVSSHQLDSSHTGTQLDSRLSREDLCEICLNRGSAFRSFAGFAIGVSRCFRPASSQFLGILFIERDDKIIQRIADLNFVGSDHIRLKPH